MSAATAVFPLLFHWLLAFGLAVARPLLLLTLNPVFTRAPITGLLRGAIASALALPMAARLGAGMPVTLPGVTLLLLSLKEATVGAALGLLLGVPFWALNVAGDVLDAQRGATQGRLNDPAGFENVSITGTLLVITTIALFVLTGGLETLTTLLYDSWRIWPPLGTLPQPAQATPTLLLGLLDQVTRQGLLLALPPVLAMLLADVALLVIARLAPSLRIDDLGLALRNIVFVVFMPLYAGFLLVYMRQDQAPLTHVLDVLGMALPGSQAP